MALVMVPENREEEFLREFYANSAFTYEGLDITDKKSNKELEKFIKEHNYESDTFLAYWFKGSVMNRIFHLSGKNKYPDNITFVVIPNYYNIQVKVGTGARWFDDIVDSNAIKQRGIDTGVEPDYA